MLSLFRLRRRGLATSCLVLSFVAGCSGLDPLALKEREVEELTFQSDRMRESLSESLTRLARSSEELRVLRAERDKLREENESLTKSLRTASEKLDVATLERNRLTVKLKEAEQTEARHVESLERVKSVASASAGELADLRVKSRDLEERLQAATAANEQFSKEREKLVVEGDALTEELVRTKAVVRSLQERSHVQLTAETAALKESQGALERENADLRGKSVALEKRVKQLEQQLEARTLQIAAGASAAGPAHKTAADGLPPSTEPQALLAGLLALLDARFEKALAGQIAWDAFDLAVAGVCGVVLLAIIFWLVRFGRIRRLKKEVRGLHLMVQELEEGAAAKEVEGEDKALTPERVARPARGGPRRTGFRAVISKSAVEERSEGSDSTLSMEAEEGPGGGTDDPFDALLAKGIATAPAQPAPARKVIGGQVVRVESTEGGADESDEMAHTQLMPSLTEADLAAPAATRSGKGSGSGEGEGGDRELLAELKSVINRKFDELLK